MNIISVPAICTKCNKAFLITPTPQQTVTDNFPITLQEQILQQTCIDKECKGDVLVPAGTYSWSNNQIRLINGANLTWAIFAKVTEALKNNLAL